RRALLRTRLAARDPPAARPGPRLTVPIRLVIADDHPIVLDGLERLFQADRDFSVVARCTDGEEALRAAHEHQPDVLVLDIRMPKRAGIGVLREVRKAQLPTRGGLLTGEGGDDVRVEA